MRERRAGPPVLIRRVLRRLFPGTRGMEVLEDLDREYGAVRARHPRFVSRGWYLIQLFRPDTWRLAWGLRRIQEAEGEASAAVDHRARRRVWVSGLSLDLKLAARMLAKSPALTVVAVVGVALGTAIGIGSFVILSTHFYPELPLEEGERVVGIQNWDVGANEAARPSLDEFAIWRQELRSVEQVSAVSLGVRGLLTGDAPLRPVKAAAMTASGFQVARVQPLVGRSLLPEDERAGAPKVVVLGYELWQRYFGGDPGIIGRPVLLGSVQHTVVGVMPAGFAFPKNQEVWTALNAEAPGLEDRGRPELFVFGRLAAGVTREQAQAELTAIGRRSAAGIPETDRHLRPQVVPFTYPLDHFNIGTLWGAARIQLMVTLLLVAIAANVAVLVYARTAMRQGEIALRGALGASRRRIIAQLFGEALLLSMLGAGLGLIAAHYGLRHVEAFIVRIDGIGFWVDYGLQPRSIAYALVLALLTALIVGVVPALKATGRRLESGLRRIGSGASARLGWAWTTLVVAQVAIAVTILPTALHLGVQEVKMGAVRAAFPAQEFLTATMGVAVPLRPGMDADDYRRETAARFTRRIPELERRLHAEPAVAGVTFEGMLPGRGLLVQVEGIAGPAESGALRLPSRGVAPGYFEVLGARILAGRELRPMDVGESGGGVVVNEAFVRRVLGGGAALGQRVRFPPPSHLRGGPEEATAGPWFEVVGVVQDLQRSVFDPEWAPPTVYYPIAPEQLQAANLLVRVRGGDPAGFAPRLRQIATAVDPDLRLTSIGNLATLQTPEYLALAVSVVLFVLVTVILLSAAGIHALMSLAVTRRRKEIGIRTALGARRTQVLASIFSRAGLQLGLGGLLGSLLGGAFLLGSGLTPGAAALFLGGVVTLMLTAGLSATVGPARRGLGVQPMEALKVE